MKIYIILQNDPFFLPKYIEDLLLKKSEKINFVGCTILNSKLINENYIQYLIKYFNIFGIKGLCKLLFKFYHNKISKKKSLTKIFDERKINIFEENNINSKKFLRILKNTRADLIVSIACNQKFNTKLFKFVKKGIINLHGGYLPDFPGVFTPFWNLYKRSKYAGCTVHWVDSNLDGGLILKRHKFKIKKNDTIFSLYDKISYKGLKILSSSLKLIKKNKIKKNNGIINNYDIRKLNTYPKLLDGIRFRKKGLKSI